MKVMMLAAVGLLVLSGVAGGVQIDVYPHDTTWTGGIFYIPSWPYWGYWWENAITWGNFFWMTTPCNERGFARYDLSPVPDRATITSALVHYYVYWDTLGPETEIRLLGIEPHPDSEPQAQEVYDSIGAGALVAELDTTARGWNAVPLDTPALRAIEQRLVTTDWLGLGWLYPGTDSADAVARGWRSDSLKTYLTVDYVLTGVEAAPQPPACRRLSVQPNPSGSGRVTVRWSGGDGGMPATVSIVAATGRVVVGGRPVGTGGSLDLTGLEPGAYLLRFGSGAHLEVHKLVIE